MNASYKPVFAIFPPSDEAALRKAFDQYRFSTMLSRELGNGKHRSGPTLASAIGLDINPIHTFTDKGVAQAAIQAKAERGGKAIAVRLVQRDPDTMMLIDPKTDKPRTVWLVGANCAVHEEAI